MENSFDAWQSEEHVSIQPSPNEERYLNTDKRATYHSSSGEGSKEIDKDVSGSDGQS